MTGAQVPLCGRIQVTDLQRYAVVQLGHAEGSPNYRRLLELGDATVAGEESEILERLRRFRDAGVTDLAARVVPYGPTETHGLRVAGHLPSL